MLCRARHVKGRLAQTTPSNRGVTELPRADPTVLSPREAAVDARGSASRAAIALGRPLLWCLAELPIQAGASVKRPSRGIEGRRSSPCSNGDEALACCDRWSCSARKSTPRARGRLTPIRSPPSTTALRMLAVRTDGAVVGNSRSEPVTRLRLSLRHATENASAAHHTARQPASCPRTAASL
jgi:hypothetical protein